MNPFLEVTAVDENGSGMKFPISINTDCIETVIDLVNYEFRPEGSNSTIGLKNNNERLYIEDTYKDILQKLKYL